MIDVPIGVYKFVRKEVKSYQGLRNLVADGEQRREIFDWVEDLGDGKLTDVIDALADLQEVLREGAPALVELPRRHRLGASPRGRRTSRA